MTLAPAVCATLLFIFYLSILLSTVYLCYFIVCAIDYFFYYFNCILIATYRFVDGSTTTFLKPPTLCPTVERHAAVPRVVVPQPLRVWRWQ